MRWKVASATWRQEVLQKQDENKGGSVICGGGEERVDLRSPGREKLKKLNVKVSANVSSSKLDKVRKAELIFYKSS